MAESASDLRKTQLFIRAITNGVLSERDLLLNYTVGEFYQEQSLFIEEQERKESYMKSLKTRGPKDFHKK